MSMRSSIARQTRHLRTALGVRVAAPHAARAAVALPARTLSSSAVARNEYESPWGVNSLAKFTDEAVSYTHLTLPTKA